MTSLLDNGFLHRGTAPCSPRRGRRPARLFMVLAAALAACQGPPPAVHSTLVAQPQLQGLAPKNIAVLPIEDATADGAAQAVAEPMREAVARALVRQKGYSSLAPSRIDEVLATLGAGSADASVVDASWLRSVGGKFGEDALLAVRVTRWDTSSLMASGRVRFALDVTMMAPGGEVVLWGGALEGEVKAGGLRGPMPRDRAGRLEAATVELATQLVRDLPARKLSSG